MNTIRVKGYKYLSRTPGLKGGRVVVDGGRMEPKWVVFYADDPRYQEYFRPGASYHYLCRAVDECRRYLRNHPEARFTKEESEKDMVRDVSYRTFNSVELAVERAWYPNEEDPVRIIDWPKSQAYGDFSKESAQHYPHTRSKWLKRRSAAHKVIQQRLAEAAISESEYLREYAKLVMEHKCKKKNKKLA